MAAFGHISTDVLYVVQHVCESFPIGKLKGLSRKLGGSFNLNVKIETTEGEFAVRILGRANTEEHLRYVQLALAALNRYGVPALTPILAVDGEPYCRIYEKLVQVTPFIHGGDFKNFPNQAYSSAAMLSRFHRTLQAAGRELVQRPGQGPMPAWSFYAAPDYYARALDRLKELPEIPVYELYKAEKLALRIGELWEQSQDRLPDAILHGDWHLWNQLYAPETGDVACVLDFDCIQTGKRILDIAYTLWSVYILLPRHASRLERPIVNGYSGMTDEELRMLPVAIAKISLFFLCHAAYAEKPDEKWRRQYRKQLPLIEWLLADGERRFAELATADEAGT
ncbi:phosphotransferase [Paenibacillus piri]|uniref:Serine kinase n=1 Tax=Paenibacillus piri TaxID=2547395 RepID=A0A4R5KEC5_9BACL|nr:phosphotransferase [Paenibacillus piri]TDF92567.1 serine kinase [Paenibacillus piri]